jgi:hypothetical protein
MDPNYPPSFQAEHPEGTKALVISILGLLCCTPLAIWSLMISKNAKEEGSDDGKIKAAYIISIVALAFLVIQVFGFLFGFVIGGFGAL